MRHALSKNGLRLGHAYTVLRTATVGGGNDNRLVRLRGPLPAKEGWRGEWADDSARWTPEALSSLQFSDDSGTLRRRQGEREAEQQGGPSFWISLVEAAASFVEAGVCFAPSPSPGRSSSAAASAAVTDRVEFPLQPPKSSASGWWAQETRKRIVLARRRAVQGRGGGLRSTTDALRNEDTATGRRSRSANEREEDAENRRRLGWTPSCVYALSVYETSAMFFSLHQSGTVCAWSRRHSVDWL